LTYKAGSYLERGIAIGLMSKFEKMLEKVLSGKNDSGIRFDDMCNLLLRLGFVRRQSGGSHVIFRRGTEYINLQNRSGWVKEYQVRQVREVLQRN
jgi:hypothetical protein